MRETVMARTNVRETYTYQVHQGWNLNGKSDCSTKEDFDKVEAGGLETAIQRAKKVAANCGEVLYVYKRVATISPVRPPVELEVELTVEVE